MLNKEWLRSFIFDRLTSTKGMRLVGNTMDVKETVRHGVHWIRLVKSRDK